MTAANFPLSWSYVLNDEGGFGEGPWEPGGAVNKGVSYKTFKWWRMQIKHLPEPNLDDLKALTDEESGEIYKHLFWDPLHCDDLPNGLDYAVFNTAIMQGVDGANTIFAKARSSTVLETIDGIIIGHLLAKMAAPNIGKFAGGWGPRIERVWNRAKAML